MRRAALYVFVASMLVAYGTFFTGDIVSGDNIIQYCQTVQIVDRHRLSFSTEDVAAILRTYDFGLNTRFGVNRDRINYSQVHGIGQSLMTVPLFVGLRAVRRAWHAATPRDITLWSLNWPVFALLGVMLTLGMCRLARVPGVVWPTLITVAAAFASPIWMFSNLPFNVVGEVLVILAAIDLCLVLEAERFGAGVARDSAVAALAALLTFGVVVRPFFGTAIPAFAGWFFYALWRSAWPRAEKRRTLTVFSAVLVCGAVALAAFNAYFFGSPLRSPYHDLAGVMNFESPWSVGVSGTFLSPLKSPLYFFPVVALLPVALGVLVWRKERVAWFVAAFLLPHVYLMPKYSMWDGGPDLFARFWLRVLPVVFLSLVAAVAGTADRRVTNALLLAATLSLTALGVRAQLLTVMTDERQVYEHVVEEIERGSPGRSEFLYHDSIPSLLAGRTLVSTTQRAGLSTPRRFLFFRSRARPMQRLPVAVAALLVSTLSLAAFSRRRRE
jgi:hypothetical protein